MIAANPSPVLLLGILLSQPSTTTLLSCLPEHSTLPPNQQPRHPLPKRAALSRPHRIPGSRSNQLDTLPTAKPPSLKRQTHQPSPTNRRIHRTCQPNLLRHLDRTWPKPMSSAPSPMPRPPRPGPAAIRRKFHRRRTPNAKPRNGAR